ncbi:MAG TPA: hypothetical protein VGF73_00295 [Chthoniobacterales bacterium]
MKPNRTLLVAAALFLTAAAATIAASAHTGTWKLNENKSKLFPHGPKNTMVVYTEGRGGKMTLAVDGVDKDGKPIHWTWEGKFDGKPHNVKGSATADAIAYKIVNDRTNELTVMKNGNVVMTGTIAVAKDGKSRLVTTTVADGSGKKHTEKAYYEKE